MSMHSEQAPAPGAPVVLRGTPEDPTLSEVHAMCAATLEVLEALVAEVTALRRDIDTLKGRE